MEILRKNHKEILAIKSTVTEMNNVSYEFISWLGHGWEKNPWAWECYTGNLQSWKTKQKKKKRSIRTVRQLQNE